MLSGETRSGKTTLINELIHHIPATERIISIEDSKELLIEHPNQVRFLKRRSGTPNAALASVWRYHARCCAMCLRCSRRMSSCKIEWLSWPLNSAALAISEFMPYCGEKVLTSITNVSFASTRLPGWQ